MSPVITASLSFSNVTTSRNSGPSNTPHLSRVFPKSRHSVVSWTMIIKKENKEYIKYQFVLYLKSRFNNRLHHEVNGYQQQQKIFCLYSIIQRHPHHAQQ